MRFMETIGSIFDGVLHVVLEASPWLVLGLVAAGLVRAFLPAEIVARWMGGRGPGSITFAAFLGAPLPLCSCGVLPVAIGLRERGASKGATASFLVATPETGLDSIALSYALLGPFFAIARPIAAIATAITAGLAVLIVDREGDGSNAEKGSGGGGGKACRAGEGVRQRADKINNNSCCSVVGGTGETPAPPGDTVPLGFGVARLSEPGADSVNDDKVLGAASSAQPCCSRTGETPVPLGTPVPFVAAKPGWVARVVEGQRYSFGRLLTDIALWLGIGLVFAGVMRAVVEPGALASLSGVWAMLAALVAGVPLYICASAATPIAAGLLATGVSPGVAIVLLLAGPATNIGALGVIRKHLGGRATTAYLGAIIVMSFASGLIVEWMVGRFGIDIAGQVGAGARHVPHWLAVGSAALLGLSILIPIVRRIARV